MGGRLRGPSMAGPRLDEPEFGPNVGGVEVCEPGDVYSLFSGASFARGAACRGPDQIRRIGPGPRRSASRLKSPPAMQNVAHVRRLSAHARANC